MNNFWNEDDNKFRVTTVLQIKLHLNFLYSNNKSEEFQ